MIVLNSMCVNISNKSKNWLKWYDRLLKYGLMKKLM